MKSNISVMDLTCKDPSGGVLEFYSSPRVIARFDCGDTTIRYGPRLLGFFPTPTKSPSATAHQLQFSAGVGFRF